MIRCMRAANVGDAEVEAALRINAEARVKDRSEIAGFVTRAFAVADLARHAAAASAARAAAAQAAFGKSWADISELMSMSAGDLRRQLDGVSEAKVIDQGELDKAKEFRDAMDNLRDVIENVQLQVGEALVPALSNLANAFTQLNEAAKFGAADGLGDFLSKLFFFSGH
jgi:hypothetical protein